MQSTDMNFEAWQKMRCKKKRRFDTKEECEMSITANMHSMDGQPLETYKCALCGSWHKTRVRQ